MPRSPFKFIEYKSKVEIAQAVILIKQYHLYVNEWMFSDWIQMPEDITHIVLCLFKDTPIAAGMRMNEEYSTDSGVFVKKKYRRVGIGTKIVKRLAKKSMECYLNVTEGIPGSEKFYSGLGSLTNFD